MSVLTRYQNLRSKYRTAGSRLREEQGAYRNLLKQQKELQESTYGKGPGSLQSKYDKAVQDYGTTQTEMTGSQGYKNWQSAKSTYETARTSAFGTSGTGGEFGDLQAKISTRLANIEKAKGFDKDRSRRFSTEDYTKGNIEAPLSYQSWLSQGNAVSYDPDGTPVYLSPEQAQKKYQNQFGARRISPRKTKATGIEAFDQFREARRTWRQEQVYHRSFDWLTDSQKELLNTTYAKEDGKTKVQQLTDWQMGLEGSSLDDLNISDYGVFENINFTQGGRQKPAVGYTGAVGWFTGLAHGRPKLYKQLGGKSFTDQMKAQLDRYGKAAEAFYGKDGEGGAVGAYAAWANQPSSWQTDQQNLATKYGLEEKQAAVTSAYEGEEYKGYRTKLAELTSDAEGYERDIKGPGGADSKLAQIQKDITASKGRIRQYGGDQALLAMTMPGAFANLSFAQETRKRGTRESAFRTTTLTSRSPYRF